MIFDPSKSCDCSSHNLDIKTGRTRDIAPVPLYMQIYVENNSVIILASKEATKHSWGLLAFLPRVRFLNHSTFQVYRTGASCGRFVFYE